MPTLTKIGRNTIHDSAVSTAQLEDGSVAVADIGTNAVGNDELINSESYTIGGLTATGTSALQGQVTMNSSSNTFSFPTGRPATNQILKASDANGTLAWDVVSVTGYSGVAWSYNITGGANETIPVNKAIVVPGPLEISNGTVTVQGRLHII
jgi:hypothetical protein